MELYVNGKSVRDYDARLKEGYAITGVEITNTSYSHMRNRSTLIYHGTELGLKNISFTIDFRGEDIPETALKKSLFDAEIYGNCELIFPDGFQYSAVCNSLGEETYHGSNIIEASYELVGIRHGNFQSVTGNDLYCDSTLPKTDCILKATVGTSGSNYKLGGVIFSQVTAGEKLCVDGITKRILVNDTPAAQRAEWTEFPYLTPGWNHIVCNDVPTVEFYPAFF